MKKQLLFALPLLALVLSACGQNTATAIPTVVLDPASPANDPGDGPSGGSVSASAEVVPQDHVNLSFPLTGTVASLTVQVGDQVSAGDPLVSLDTLILEARVAEAEANVAAAETQVRYLRRVGPGDEQLNAAIAEVERTQAVVEQVRATLAQAVLTAPIDGTVVDIDIAPGETVTPGRVVVILGDLANMRIETIDLSEQDVPAVRVGQSAVVFIDALAAEFDGEVVDIARLSETIGGDVVYKVTIALDEQPEGLRWGMSAEVEIRTEQ
jgi:multidrug efflux pump subunit AcrA (membrane-fusion protein)